MTKRVVLLSSLGAWFAIGSFDVWSQVSGTEAELLQIPFVVTNAALALLWLKLDRAERQEVLGPIITLLAIFMAPVGLIAWQFRTRNVSDAFIHTGRLIGFGFLLILSYEAGYFCISGLLAG